MSRSASRIEHVQNVVDALTLKVESLPSMSAQQSRAILEMVAKFEERFNGMNLWEKMGLTASRCGNASNVTPGCGQNTEASDSGVVRSVHRLSALVDEKDRVAESEDAEDIIDNLETLLRGIDTTIQHQELGTLKTQGTKSFGGDREHRRELKQALGILGASPKLILNPQGRIHPVEESRKESTKLRYTKVNMANG
ncbi:hypothetical protein CSPAE12_06631 [Colletotrichum incanum]|nr:hypothetical protein CSPAE12_06631 [Colletotrichum incanum]